MTERVAELRFLNFRGLPNYLCRLERKNLVVLGGNGKGKSAIVDGIEYLFSGKVRRFHGEGTGDISSSEAIPHILNLGAPSVQLHFSPNSYACRSFPEGSLIIPEEESAQEYFGTHPPAEAFVLRRSQILEFISDQDASRYKKYIQLLGLTEVDGAQRHFVDAAQRAETQKTSRTHSVETLLAQFRDSSTGWLPTDLASILSRCSDLVLSLGMEPLLDWNELGPTLSALELRRIPNNRTLIDQLTAAIACFQSTLPSGLAELADSTNVLQANLLNLRTTDEEAAKSDIIEQAIAYFGDREGIAECPLCEKALDDGYASVFARLTARSVALGQLRESESRRNQLLGQLVTSAQRIADQLGKDLQQSPLLPPEDVRILRGYKAVSLRWHRLLMTLLHHRSLDPLHWTPSFVTLNAIRSRIELELKTRKTALIPSGESRLEDATALLKKARDAELVIRKGEGDRDDAILTARAAVDARDAFTRARETAIQTVFDRIACKVLTYYRKLHDVDTHNKSECTDLSLTPTSRSATGGLKLAIRFLSREGGSDPRAFLSEGHLDSLGLCLYLATVRTFNKPGSLLVLDDVLTSVDREHRTRVSELIFEEFADYQLILTTHDEYWFGLLQSGAAARGQLDYWRFNRIVNWTVEAGPESAAFEATWEFIDANLNDSSYRALGGPLRVTFEDFLKRVAEKMELKVRYKSDASYSTGDFLFAGLQNKLRDKLTELCPNDKNTILTDLGRVFGNTQLLNLLSHDNPGRLEVTFREVKDFVDGLRSLAVRCKANKLIRGIAS